MWTSDDNNVSILFVSCDKCATVVLMTGVGEVAASSYSFNFSVIQNNYKIRTLSIA